MVMEKEFTFIYKHNNGAHVYETADGKKHIEFDGQAFRTIGEVNDYIKKNQVQLSMKKQAAEKKQSDPYYLSNHDWQKLKGE